MNIIVSDSESRCSFRPDTSWERKSGDLYPPEDFNSFYFTPVICARVFKPGRAVGERFAHRYLDTFSIGMLLYDGNAFSADGRPYPEACCIDHSSYIPTPEWEHLHEGVLSIRLDGNLLWSGEINDREGKVAIGKALCDVSRHCLIRTGDFVCKELCPPLPLAKGSGHNYHVEAFLGEELILDYTIIC